MSANPPTPPEGKLPGASTKRRWVRESVMRLWHWVFPVYSPVPELRTRSEYVTHFMQHKREYYEQDVKNADQQESAWLQEAHRLALDIRKFEIELYWKRATYFWTLIAAAFAGFFALATSDQQHPRMVFLIACIGVVLSVGWYFVNRGSKYWQENWERHVDVLEDGFVGPLYKTTLAREEFHWRRFWDGYPYSVSKINQLISLFIATIWIGLAALSFPEAEYKEQFRTASSWILGIGTLCVVLLLTLLGRTGAKGKPRRVNFDVSPLRPTREERAD